MSEQVSAHVRALFSELGVSIVRPEREAHLVIDRFEQWRIPAGAHAAPSVGSFTCRGDVWADAA